MSTQRPCLIFVALLQVLPCIAASPSETNRAEPIRIEPDGGLRDGVEALGISRNGEWLLAATRQGISIIHRLSGRLAGHVAVSGTEAVAMSDDNDIVVSLANDDDEQPQHDGVRLTHWRTGAVVRTIAPVNKAALGVDGSAALVSRRSGEVELLDLSHGTARWSLRTNKPLATGRALALSADLSTAAVVLDDGTVQLLSASDGRVIAEWSLPSRMMSKQVTLRVDGTVISQTLRPLVIRNVVLSHDGKGIGLCDANRIVWAFDAEGRERLAYGGGRSGTNSVDSVAFADDGEHLIVGWYGGPEGEGESGRITRLRLSDAQVVHQVEMGLLAPRALAVSDSDGVVYAGSANWHIDTWNPATGERKAVAKGRGAGFSVAAISPNGRTLATVRSGARAVQLWDLQAGRRVRLLPMSGEPAALAWTPDGERLISSQWNGPLVVWTVGSDAPPTIVPMNVTARELEVSADGQRLVSVYQDRSVRVWDTIRWLPVGSAIQLHEYSYRKAVAMDATGERIAHAEPDGAVVLKRVFDGRELARLEAPRGPRRASCIDITQLRFDVTGATLAIGGDFCDRIVPSQSFVNLWQLRQGRTTRMIVEPTGKPADGFSRLLGGVSDKITALAWTPDGALFVAGERNWRRHQVGGRVGRGTLGGLGKILTLQYRSPEDGLVVVGEDGRIELRGADLRPIGQLFQLDDDGWLAVTPEGYFDASSFSAAQGLTVVRGSEVWAMDDFWEAMYRPDIVRRRFRGLPVETPLTSLEAIIRRPPPKVSLRGEATPDARSLRLHLTVESTGGGVGQIRIAHNGKIVRRGRPGEGNFCSPTGIPERCEGSIELPAIAGEDNEVVALAFNGDGTLQGKPAQWRFTSPLAAEPARLWIVAVGLDRFRADSHGFGPLSNATNDARGMATVLGRRAGSLFGDERILPVDIGARLLLDHEATLASIRRRFEELAAQARPSDTVVWIFATNGTLDERGRFALVPHDVSCADAECRQPTGLLPADELLERMQAVSSLRQLLVLDTCHAGAVNGVVSGLYDARISVLARSVGIHVFAAAMATEAASDGVVGGHGLFTQHLLEALDEVAADEDGDGLVTSAEWGRYARSRMTGAAPIAADRGAIRVDAEALGASRKARRQTPVLLLVGRDFGLARAGSGSEARQ